MANRCQQRVTVRVRAKCGALKKDQVEHFAFLWVSEKEMESAFISGPWLEES